MYTPNQPPNDPNSISAYLVLELLRISDALHEIDVNNINFEVTHVLPDKVIEGMVFYFAADVITDPSPKGLYQYDGVAWIAL